MSPFALLFAAALAASNAAPAKANPKVALETSKGKIVLELFADKAPGSTKNFLAYVRSGHYDGTVFHRVIPGFMVQGGGMTADLAEKETMDSILNEAGNGLQNKRGTVAMARTGEPHSATSQFFINTVDNAFLNQKDKTPRGFGYAVFGKVVEGMNVVDAIEKVKTGNKGPYQDVPLEAVVITKATVVE
jgi:cyclophilin family peptidyl-prolyl cis-trans isomerase